MIILEIILTAFLILFGLFSLILICVVFLSAIKDKELHDEIDKEFKK